MNNPKITARPPSSAEDFIKQAGKPTAFHTSLPWEGSNIRADVQKVFSLNLPEEYIVKLKFISEKNNKSQQKIMREIICPAIDQIISNLLSVNT